MTYFRTIRYAMAAVVLLALTSAMPAVAQGRASTDCLSDRQIQTAIESGTILSWPKIKKLAGMTGYQEVSDVQVCMIDGVPFYILNVIAPGGEATKIALNAVDGTEELL